MNESKTTYSAPKEVIQHPAVESCTSGEATGSDYKHYVELKPGWRIVYPYDLGSLFFHTVKDWRYYKTYIEFEIDQEVA